MPYSSANPLPTPMFISSAPIPLVDWVRDAVRIVTKPKGH